MHFKFGTVLPGHSAFALGTYEARYQVITAMNYFETLNTITNNVRYQELGYCILTVHISRSAF